MAAAGAMAHTRAASILALLTMACAHIPVTQCHFRTPTVRSYYPLPSTLHEKIPSAATRSVTRPGKQGWPAEPDPSATEEGNGWSAAANSTVIELVVERQALGYGGGGTPSPPSPIPADVCSFLRLYTTSGPMATGAKDWGSNGTNSRFMAGPCLEVQYCSKIDPCSVHCKPAKGPMATGAKDTNSHFMAGPCLKVSGIHLAQTPDKRLIFTDWTIRSNPLLKFPGSTQQAYAVELDLATGGQRPVDVVRESFCSGGAFLPDGTLIAVGGGLPSKNRKDPFCIRAYVPCPDTASSCHFTVQGLLTSARWYPTAQVLPEGRVLIVGGARRGGSVNANGVNNPTIEYWPPRSPGDRALALGFLGSRTMPFNLFPMVHLLPSGKVFIFAGSIYTLFDTSTNQEVVVTTPPLFEADAQGRRIFRNYPVAATSVLFPLSSSNSYSAEIMICGGNSRVPMKALASPAAADHHCWRIKPEDEDPAWVEEHMCADYPACSQPVPRVMGDAVLLADGSVLIINGASGKKALVPESASGPVLTPLLYSPYNYTWNTVPLATSFVPRLYHSSALLLHDATVLVGGSNPNTKFNLNNLFYPSESRTEIFVPPYFYLGLEPPSLINVPESVAINTQFIISFLSQQTGGSSDFMSRFRLVLSHAGMSTHSQRQSMRNVDLDFININDTSTEANPGSFQAAAMSPPSLSICPPTFYWLFLLENGVPNKEGVPLFITSSDTSSPSPSTLPPPPSPPPPPPPPSPPSHAPPPGSGGLNRPRRRSKRRRRPRKIATNE